MSGGYAMSQVTPHLPTKNVKPSTQRPQLHQAAEAIVRYLLIGHEAAEDGVLFRNMRLRDVRDVATFHTRGDDGLVPVSLQYSLEKTPP